MALTLDDLFESPDHYLHSFEGDSALFVPMDRAAYHRSIFLDRRISTAGQGMMRMPFSALAARTDRPLPIGWIFHVAHCGSTLLARALDRISANIVLREPLALRQLAVAGDATALPFTARMLSKRYRADLPTIVKANVPVNFLLPDLIALDPGMRSIFLHCGIRDYLLAILRDDNHRSWMRGITTALSASIGDVENLPDSERAAALWLAQMRAFGSAISALPHARSLDSEAFFADPRHLLGIVAAHLGVPMTEAEVAEVVDGPLFSTYSKNPAIQFDNEARMARRAEIETTLGPELKQAQDWLDRRADEAQPALETIAAVSLTV